MRPRQILLLIALTLVYLCCELAFNARLLDVVGGSADSQQIHQIERFGRALSGIAAALFVLQRVIRRRNASQGVSPSPQWGAALVLGSALLVYAALNVLVDTLVARSTPEFRRVSQNIVLVQRALVQGRVELDGLGDDPELLRQPAGKAFLAQFSWMAASVDRLDDKIRSAKLSLIESSIGERMGDAQGLHGNYQEAVKETQSQWRRYASAPPLPDVDAEVARQQDKAWSNYVSDLGRRGWTPSTVPAHAQATVRRKVRSRVAVPAGWELSDEAGFRRAVEQTVRRQLEAASGARRAAAGMPPDLSWPAFFAHARVQEALRRQIEERIRQKMGQGGSPLLRLPAGLRLLPSYPTGRAFQDEVFTPVVKSFAQQELARYDAPVSAFADGAELAQRGRDAARLALVPPIALFFSMLGALLHCTKLLYLVLTLARERLPRWQAHRVVHPLPVAVGACLLSIGLLATMDNAVTRSRLFTYLHQQVLANADDTVASQLKHRFIAGSLRVVAVGQDRFYPLFEFIRVHALRGFHFGYDDSTKN